MKQIAQATATILKNVKRGAQIGVLGTALVAGPLMGCANPSDGNTNTYEENTGNNNGNTNDNTGNNSGNTNTGNTNDNTGNTGNSGNTNDNTGNSGTVTPEPEPSKQYGTPYDKTIGNGNYVLHNFISDNDNIKDNLDMKHYLELGETYINDLATDFKKSTQGRTTYFDNFINTINEHNDLHSGLNIADYSANNISSAAEPIYTDVVSHLNDIKQAFAFLDVYRTMANEAYREGLGKFRDYNSEVTRKYEKEKAEIEGSAELNPYFQEFGFTAGMEYDQNFFNNLTNLSDRLLGVAAQNMNNAGKNVTIQDLQKVMNTTLALRSLYGSDIQKKNLLNHRCNMLLDDVNCIFDAAMNYTPLTQDQDQGLSM